MALSETLLRWRRRGAFARVRDLDVFHVAEGRGPTLLVLHGFPTSAYDFSAALPGLAARHRVVLLDLPGFGLSSKPAVYSYSLVEQADVVVGLCAELGIKDAHVLSHDMGTSVACELLARREQGTLPFALRSLTLMNGSVHLEMARLTASQKLLRRPLLGAMFARVASKPVFKLQFRRLFGRADAVPDDELDRLWELLTYDDGARRLPQIIRYLDERVLRAPRWLPPLTRLDVPALLLWGNRDPVAVVAIAERLAREMPSSRLITLDGLGHYPQLEDPGRVVDAVDSFLAAIETRASLAATPAR